MFDNFIISGACEVCKANTTVIIVHAYNFTHLHKGIKPQHVIYPAAVDLNII